MTPADLAEADRVAALVRKKRNAIVKEIGSADLTKDEADSLFTDGGRTGPGAATRWTGPASRKRP